MSIKQKQIQCSEEEEEEGKKKQTTTMKCSDLHVHVSSKQCYAPIQTQNM